LLEFSVDSAEHGVGNERAVLVVGAEPLRPGDEEVLGNERALDAKVVDAGAAGSDIAAGAGLKAPVFGEPVRAAEIESAQIGALHQGGASLHVVVGHAEGHVVAVVVAHTGQRVDNDVSAVGDGFGGGALVLCPDSGCGSQKGNGKERSDET